MIDLSKLRKKKRLSSVLGLTLDGTRLEGVVLRRTNGDLQVQQSFSVTLSLDPLTAAPELIGREIRNHLDTAGVREKFCIVGLQLKWALTTHVQVPPLPAEDVASFIQLEAERGFHSDVATLHFATSFCKLEAGKQHALLVGIPRSHLSALETGLRAAKLKPVSFSLGISALQPPVPEGGVLAIAIGENQVSLEISCGGGVAALRTLEAALELEGGRKILHADLVGREARITLGQLPAELRDSVRSIRIFGPRDLAQQLADEMELRFESGGLKVEIVSRYSAADFGVQVPGERAVAPAFSLAANYLADRKPAFELLPPRVSPWQQMSNRYATGKLRKAGAVAGAIAAIIIAAFVFQQIQLVSLRSQWNGMSAQVKDLKGLEDRIKQFRPWYDENYRDLSILKALTQAFPEDGVVSAKTIEIRDLSTVTCTGTTRDQRELLKMLERLRADTNSIANLKIGPIRGAKPPMQFSFDFQWKEGPPK